MELPHRPRGNRPGWLGEWGVLCLGVQVLLLRHLTTGRAVQRAIPSCTASFVTVQPQLPAELQKNELVSYLLGDILCLKARSLVHRYEPLAGSNEGVEDDEPVVVGTGNSRGCRLVVCTITLGYST